MNVVINSYDDVLLAMRATHYERNFTDSRFDIEFFEKHASAIRAICDFHIPALTDMFLAVLSRLILQFVHKFIYNGIPIRFQTTLGLYSF